MMSTDPRAIALRELYAELRACRACVEAGHLANAAPLADFAAKPDASLMLVGQAPSAAAITQQIPFAGVGGRRLTEWFAWAGLSEATYRQEFWLVALTRCFPGPSPTGKGDRRPSPAEMALCRRFLDRQLAIAEPELVILVGGLAIETFLGKSRLVDVVGRLIENAGRHWLPWPHPSGVSLWLNDPTHVALVRQSATALRDWLACHRPDIPLAPVGPTAAT